MGPHLTQHLHLDADLVDDHKEKRIHSQINMRRYDQCESLPHKYNIIHGAPIGIKRDPERQRVIRIRPYGDVPLVRAHRFLEFFFQNRGQSVEKRGYVPGNDQQDRVPGTKFVFFFNIDEVTGPVADKFFESCAHEIDQILKIFYVEYDEVRLI